MKSQWASDALFDLTDQGSSLPRLHNPVVMRERVLMVEDDEALRTGMAEHLDARGFDVTCVADGLTALEQLLFADFDVILLDLGIPRMSGQKLLHELRREREIPRLPIVLLTGSDIQDAERAARHGVFAVHRKPAKARHIAQSLRSAVYYG
ncbi:Sensory transduction protein regX3 [Planctomycetes bacterium Poly30]|uniref:Sensory transduction protein regX3 n=2 Tax=Saltatorellus ferox TaxID=2528018 RepID=A0A518EQZ5_9BACT|nr:Sensory transduction protein regX3 [Planctomycetes bacterium Poly30]